MPAWRTPLIAFGTCFVLLLVIALAQGSKPFYYDSGGYWQLGSRFVRDGDFSLLNFDSPLRGYLLPLVDHGLQGIAVAVGWSSSTSARTFNALVLAAICGVLGPAVAELAWSGRRWGPGRRLALAAVFVVFWREYLSYPLSDFSALAFVLLAIVAAARPLTPTSMLLAGVATAAAIDARPAYATLLVLVPALIAWNLLVERRPRGRGALARAGGCLALLCIGFTVVSLPQALLTHRHFKSWSFIPGSVAHLESLQLSEGLRLQRYETFVGIGHGPQMNYLDPSGTKLLDRRPGAQVAGLGQYASLAAANPVTLGGVLVRHVVNGLDQRYSTPYVEHLDTGGQRWMRALGFLLVFLALLRLAWPAARRRLGRSRWRYPVALLLCCVTSVPSAMETRFLLPVYLLAYLLVLAAGWPSPLVAGVAGWRRYRTVAAIAVACVPFALVCWAVTSAASSHLHFG